MPWPNKRDLERLGDNAKLCYNAPGFGLSFQGALRPPQQQADTMAGSKLGSYEILEEIGHGGMATVYRARQPTMDRFVAI
jgi:serine/threonine protein kinase